MARERRSSGQLLTAEQAGERLGRLTAYVHQHPGRVAERLQALMSQHRLHRVEASVAHEEALALLGDDREDAEQWCDEHAGTAAYWPTRESLAMRERVRVVS